MSLKKLVNFDAKDLDIVTEQEQIDESTPQGPIRNVQSSSLKTA
jgi:hypothetical protein